MLPRNRPHALILLLCLVFAAASHAQEPPPDIPLADAVAACATDANPDACLAATAITYTDVSVCFDAPSPLMCGERVLDVTAPTCEAQSDPQACLLTLALEGVEAACDRMRPVPPDCYLAAAGEAGDITVVERRFEAPAQDAAYAKYAIYAGDLNAVDNITDNRTYDDAYIYTAMVAAIRNETAMPPALCNNLRGDYDNYPDDFAMNQRLCLMSSAVVTALDSGNVQESARLLAQLLDAEESDIAAIIAGSMGVSLTGDTEADVTREDLIAIVPGLWYIDNDMDGVCDPLSSNTGFPLGQNMDAETLLFIRTYNHIGANVYTATTFVPMQDAAGNDFEEERLIQMTVLSPTQLRHHVTVVADGSTVVDHMWSQTCTPSS